MDQEKIGKFILDRRSKMKLTQLELAEKIGVTDKAVSKWERGKGMPDYSLFLPLCDALDVTVNELLSGELNSKNDDSIPKYLEFEGKKNKKKIICLVFVSILICLSLVLGIFFINNYKNIYIYEIKGKGEYLEYNNGAFVISNIKNILIPGDISDTVITPNDKIILSQTFVVGSKNRVLYENYTGDIISENYGEEIVFDDEVLDEIKNDLRLIVYFMIGDEVYKDEIKLELVKSFSNDRLINKKNVSTEKKEILYFEDKNYDRVSLYKKFLLSEGFSKVRDINGLSIPLSEYSLVKFINKKESLVVNYLSNSIRYVYYDKDTGIYYTSSTYDYDYAVDYGRNWFTVNFKDNNGVHSGCYDFDSKIVSCFKDKEYEDKYSKKIVEIGNLFDKYRFN